MPQPFEPHDAIGDSQRLGELLGACARNHLVLGGVDHQHAAVLGPLAQGGGEPQRIGRRDLRLHLGPLRRRQLLDHLAQVAGFRGRDG